MKIIAVAIRSQPAYLLSVTNKSNKLKIQLPIQIELFDASTKESIKVLLETALYAEYQKKTKKMFGIDKELVDDITVNDEGVVIILQKVLDPKEFKVNSDNYAEYIDEAFITLITAADIMTDQLELFVKNFLQSVKDLVFELNPRDYVKYVVYEK